MTMTPKEDPEKNSSGDENNSQWGRSVEQGLTSLFWGILGTAAMVLLFILLFALVLFGFVAGCYGLGYLLARILPITPVFGTGLVLVAVCMGVLTIVLLFVLSVLFSSQDLLEKIAFDLNAMAKKRIVFVEDSDDTDDGDPGEKDKIIVFRDDQPN
jgi:hypothetical protein